MIDKLRRLGVEPQAIEQPLDLSVPENKMMLAFYLAVPEVENDRRALNVRAGMYRAMKEGRYMGLAPYGYENKSDENGKKFIRPRSLESSIMKWVFEELNRGVYNADQIFKMARNRGFNKARSLFYFAIRNPVYCGRIFVPAYKGDESMFVKGQHEPLISEYLFDCVQEILDGKRRSYNLKIVANTELPLRGLLLCPECSKVLTGSASKGRSKYYTYYHCFAGCRYRLKAEVINDQLMTQLERFIARPYMLSIYEQVLVEAYQEATGTQQEIEQKSRKQIESIEKKLSYARELLFSKAIAPEDFHEKKEEYEQELRSIKLKIADSQYEINIKHVVSHALEALKLNVIFSSADIEEKQRLLTTLFPEKFTIVDGILRTGRINQVAEFIYLINNKLSGLSSEEISFGDSENVQRGNRSVRTGTTDQTSRLKDHYISTLSENKKGQNSFHTILSSQVGKTGFEPATPWSQTRCATGLRYFPEPMKRLQS